MIGLLVNLLILIGILAVLWWGYTQIAPKLPEPFRIVLVILIVIVAIVLLLQVGGLVSFGSLGTIKH